jgi:murein DD-endopeptidase MepM/ murein hydrolase activator NlpD
MTLSERGKWATFPQLGDTIAGYQISSAFWPRKSPDPGCSSMHFGTDVATLMYTPLYANGPIGGTVNQKHSWQCLSHTLPLLLMHLGFSRDSLRRN